MTISVNESTGTNSFSFLHEIFSLHAVLFHAPILGWLLSWFTLCDSSLENQHKAPVQGLVWGHLDGTVPTFLINLKQKKKTVVGGSIPQQEQASNRTSFLSLHVLRTSPFVNILPIEASDRSLSLCGEGGTAKHWTLSPSILHRVGFIPLRPVSNWMRRAIRLVRGRFHFWRDCDFVLFTFLSA